MEGLTAILECEVSKPNMDAEWYKDGVRLQDGGRYKILMDGVRHVLHIEDVEYEDEAEYSVKIADKSSMATLLVEGTLFESLSGCKGNFLTVRMCAKSFLYADIVLDIQNNSWSI